ncbi:MAG TPA: hypothetical protein VLK33_10340 [Terriglobales bacterium]|nr:hypothetical protein [Terriglobales bacterium]
MDIPELTVALQRHYLEHDYDKVDPGPLDLDLMFEKSNERIGFLLCPDKTESMAYLGAFETAMQRVVDARQKDSKLNLGLAVAFASTAEGESPSYRRALYKYSNSIVFEDLDLSLYLITGNAAIDILPPGEVNEFLRNLNEWIAERNA